MLMCISDKKPIEKMEILWSGNPLEWGLDPAVSALVASRRNEISRRIQPWASTFPVTLKKIKVEKIANSPKKMDAIFDRIHQYHI